MTPSDQSALEKIPSSSNAAYQRDRRLWAALLGEDARRRAEAARTVQALELHTWYAQQLLEAVPELLPAQRARAGDAVALLGDPRFVEPHFLSEMLYVPGGVVVIGSDDYREEQPVHTIDVSGFALSKFPVTQASYAACVKAKRVPSPRGWQRGAPQPSQLNAPVAGISAREAEAYCHWLAVETGFEYRLPTEAEWMLAARSAGNARVYPWGYEFDARRANAWTEGSPKRICAVGLFPEGQGPYGHEDLAGNVWEWCSSLNWPYPYNPIDGREDPDSDHPRVLHGGSWRSRPVSIRCAARQGQPPDDRLDVVGFRIARDGAHG